MALTALAAWAGGSTKGPFWPHPTRVMMAAKAITARCVPCVTVDISPPDKLEFNFIVKKHPMPVMLTDSEYHTAAQATLDHIEAQVDRWLEQDLIDIDTHRTGGLLELTFPNRSQIIINTQPPLQELWVAARSGGFHYKHISGEWRNTRDHSPLLEALSACVSEQAGIALVF